MGASLLALAKSYIIFSDIALLRDVFLTVYSKKTILYLSLLFSFSYRSKHLHFSITKKL